jgi:hypothetical protein
VPRDAPDALANVLADFIASPAVSRSFLLL